MLLCFHTIYHCGGEPEWAMHCWFNVMAQTAEFVTIWLFHECGKQYFVQPFLRSIKLLRLHAHFNLTSHWRYELNFSHLWVSIMHGLTWSELNYCAWFVLSVSSLSLSVMVCSCHACIFVPRVSFMPMLCSGSSPSPTRQQAGHIACTMHETTWGRSVFMKYLNAII